MNPRSVYRTSFDFTTKFIIEEELTKKNRRSIILFHKIIWRGSIYGEKSLINLVS
jgi:hypothetical protein